MQSSSSVPADITVYVSTKAPTCPDMPKQRAVLCMPRAPPSLFAGLPGVCSSSHDKAMTSSDMSCLSREQLLQHIDSLQADNTQHQAQATSNGTINTKHKPHIEDITSESVV
ncbi:hypothetical protein OEZ85_003835 [Tetradesmus obliquus]|uniref:Uncharacterized protein n=1 Tax=Tetradesmus obliquus TaxID=3088 RepID=A0ABY8UDD7_TETOB|nr:hypothetical protein OEZ85_003835 [Tetradesmus obliquus]